MFYFFMPLGTEKPPQTWPIATLTIIGINVMVWLFLNSLSLSALLTVLPVLAGSCNPLSWFTAEFVHLNFEHLGLNTIFGLSFGCYLEGVLGRKRFLFYYLVAGAAGGFFELVIIGLFSQFPLPKCAFGASGSISGLMGVFLVRCYYNKIKLGLSLYDIWGLLPKRVAVSPILYIGYYAIKNLYFGMISLDNPYYRIAYWDHFGSLLAGVALALHYREHLQAKLERCRERVRTWLDQGIELDQARRDLCTLLEADPRDPWALADLARLEAQNGRTAESERLYRLAIQTLWKKGEEGWAAHLFGEYLRTYPRANFGAVPFQIFERMAHDGEGLAAAHGLKLMIRRLEKSRVAAQERLLHRSYILLAQLLSRKLDRPEAARDCLNRFLRRYPKSPCGETADALLKEISSQVSGPLRLLEKIAA